MSKILIVEDEPQMNSLLSHILRGEGYTVLSAENGLEAEKLYRENEFDVVITDIVMPEKDGLEFIQSLRDKKSTTKILAISGGGAHNSSISYLKAARALGADFILPKPFHMEQILRCLSMLGHPAGN